MENEDDYDDYNDYSYTYGNDYDAVMAIKYVFEVKNYFFHE